jgi:hypothetical protein
MSLKEGIRKRLQDYINKRYGTVSNLTKETGIPASTIRALFGGQKSVPGSELLMRLKLSDPGMDLNYIIAGTKSTDLLSVEDPEAHYKPNEITELTKVLIKSQTQLIETLKECLDNKSGGTSVTVSNA